jgi:hypothetical protein
MYEDFDPLNLDARASINRTTLADLPEIEPALHGRRASDLLSSLALRRAIRDESDALKLQDRANDHQDLLLALDDCLISPDSGIRQAGEHLAARFGTYLAYLLLTLTRDATAPASRPYREYWSHIRKVWLGGGVVSGRLGPLMRDAATSVLRASDSDLCLNVALHPQMLPLIGAARSVGVGSSVALVYDFGGSLVKHGWATYEGGALTGLGLLSPEPSPIPPYPLPAGDESVLGHKLAGYICDLIARDFQTAEQRGLAIGGEVAFGLACYIRGNHPLNYPGAGYMSLRHLSPSAGEFLGRPVSARLGRDVRLSLLHDGTAAARVFAGEPSSAVLMLGTWLGVGFAPVEHQLTSIAPAFDVTTVSQANSEVNPYFPR